MENCLTASGTCGLVYTNVGSSTISAGSLVGEYPIRKNKIMKEENLKSFDLVFEETHVSEFTHRVLATDLEDAKQILAKGQVYCPRISEKVVSINRVIKS